MKIGVLRFELFILIIPTVPWHMLTPSESTFLLGLCIDLLPGFWVSVTISRIKITPFIKEFVSVHHHIMWTGLKNITQMLLSIEIMVHFYSTNEWNPGGKNIRTTMESAPWCSGYNNEI